MQCAAFLARNFQDMAMQQLPASFDPHMTLFMEQFRRAYTFTKKTEGQPASWNANA